MNSDMPSRVRSTLLTHLAISTAHQHFHESHEHETIYHPGDSFGAVLGWLWHSDQKPQAERLVVELTAELRVHNPHVTSPRLTLDSILNGIGYALPNDVSSEERTALKDHMAVEVPKYFDDDVNLV